MLRVLSPDICVPIRTRCRSILGPSLRRLLEEVVVVPILDLLLQVRDVVLSLRRILDLRRLGQDVVSRVAWATGESNLHLSWTLSGKAGQLCNTKHKVDQQQSS